MDKQELDLFNALVTSPQGWAIIWVSLIYLTYNIIRPIVGTKAERTLDKRLGDDFKRLCDKIDQLCNKF